MPVIRRRRPASAKTPRPLGRGSGDNTAADCGVYVDGVRLPGVFNHRDAIRHVRETGSGFVWIVLHEPDAHQMDTVADELELHELIAEDATSGGQRPKLEAYDDALVLNMATVTYLDHASVLEVEDIVSTGEILVILGRDFVVTIHHGDSRGLADIREDVERSPTRLELGPAAVMHAVADRVVDGYLEVAAGLAGDIDALESMVFLPRSAVDIELIYFLKRELLELKHDIVPLTQPLHRLGGESLDFVPAEIRHYFRDVQDHNARAAAAVTTLDEQITSLVSAAVAIIGVQQNTDMRKISAWVAIAAVPTMIAGIYGMNFTNMPELELKYAYFVVIAIIITICVILFRLFRKNRWL